MQVERFIRAMYFPPFDGAAMLVNGRQMPVESLEAEFQGGVLSNFAILMCRKLS